MTEPPQRSLWKVRGRGEDIRSYILSNVEQHPRDIAGLTADHFGVTRQAVHKHLRKLVTEKSLTSSGKTRETTYRLASLVEWRKDYRIAPDFEEDVAWREASEVVGPLPANVREIWQFCFTEMVNNAIDHSGGTEVVIEVAKTAVNTQVAIADDGVGIFRRIQTALDLSDERHAVLELSKGKLTTDPLHHSGQGVFFASRMMDSYIIFSGQTSFRHDFGKKEDWIFEQDPMAGTTVYMKLSNHSSRTTKQIFDQYSSGDDYGFTKTVVPVELARYGSEQLVSRSQAKRVLARMDLFRTVMFDFAGVDTIGQAFADEIFRVFARSHPEIELIELHATSGVQQMINRARAQWREETQGKLGPLE